MVIVNDWRIDPITVVTGWLSIRKKFIDRLKEARRTIVVEATEEAKKMGAFKVFNVIVPEQLQSTWDLRRKTAEGNRDNGSA